MMKKTILSFSLFFLCFNVFSQQNNSLSGKIKSESEYLSEVLLEFQMHKISKFAVSNTNGEYQFTSINYSLNDTLIIKVNYLGYKPFVKSIIITQEKMNFDVDLEKSDGEVLKEVVIKAKEKTEHTASKSTYKINQKDFIANAKAPEVLGKLPNVYCNRESGKTIVEGNLAGKFFIDGIEALPNEVKNINASTIDKIEIISNPSSIYGTDFLGAIINIIIKKTTEQFLKGSIETTGGFKNNYCGISPTIEYRKGIFSFKTNMSYLQNNQIITDELNRNDSNGNYVRNSTNNSNTIQNSINSIIGFKFSEKSDLTIKGYNGGYTSKDNLIGTSSLNNSNIISYTNSGKTIHKDLEIGSVFKHNFGETKTFYFKNKYAVLSDNSNSVYTNQVTDYFDVKSKVKEVTWNASYNIGELKILKKQTTVLYDIKYINRNYSFSNTDFYVKQNIFDATSDVSINWSENFSSQLTLTLEHSNNKSDIFSKEYNLILPTFNALYHFKNKIDVSLGYSRKILRPSPSDLNETLIISSPLTALQGNSNLDQQKRNYYFLRFNKEFKTDNASLKFYSATINNSIVNVYKTQGELLVRTLDNAAKFNSTGLDFDYSTKLFKKIGIDFNYGMNYNVYETNNLSVLIKKNSGVGYSSSVNMYSNFFKNKVSLSLSGTYAAPEYTLLSKSISYPFLDFSASTNLFKERIGLRLYAQNILGNNATIVRDTSFADNFQQSNMTKNNFTNLLLSITYNFGKKFENNIDDNTLENEDIRK